MSNKSANKVYNALVKLLGTDKCSKDPKVLEPLKKDCSIHSPGKPDMVVYPENTQEVSDIMKICYKHKMIVIPMGLNTGLEGQTIAIKGGVILSTKRMRKVIKLYRDDFQVTVEPGLRITELNEILKKDDFFFAVSPGSDPFIGGAIACSASGTQTPKYFTVKENVVNLEIVLSDGKVIKTKNRSIKCAAGYNLTDLFIGSEGTLGVITKATLKVYKVPKSVSSAIVHFKSLEDASKTVIEIKHKRVHGVARMEIVNSEGIKAVNMLFKTDYAEEASLFLEFHGRNDGEVESYAKECQELSKKFGGSEYRFTVDEEERKKLWHARHKIFKSSSKMRPKVKTAKLCVTDVCVPISAFSRVITETEKDFLENNIMCPIVGHSADGNFHVNSLVDFASKEEMKVYEEAKKRLITRAIEAEGTCTGEHGIGLGKKDALVQEFGKVAVNLMKSIKKAVDPRNIMNPGKIF